MIALWDQLSSPTLFLFAGPCVIENEALCLKIASQVSQMSKHLNIPFVFKASYDKANRSSAKSFRGPGLEKGLDILHRIKSRLKIPLITDIHSAAEAEKVGRVVDIIQIPAFLSRQTDLLKAASETGCIINVKKAQFASPNEMRNVVDKLRIFGTEKLLLTERGTSFGYHNLVADMRSIPIMKGFGCPVIFDATHSVQLPGSKGDRSDGQREFAPVLAKAAVAAGANGLFIETHPDPDRALSDGANMISLDKLPNLMKELLAIYKVIESQKKH